MNKFRRLGFVDYSGNDLEVRAVDRAHAQAIRYRFRAE
jgi:hypothetical protein